MSTLTSTLSYAAPKTSTQIRALKPTKRAHALHTAARRNATGFFARVMESIRSTPPETFYQDHTVAIFMGMFLETAMGPLMGLVAVYLYNHGIL